jgi:Protein of unknown function (DUF3800)
MPQNFQAFVDDSYTTDAEFVLGGHIAAPEAWAAFSSEWEALLPSGTLSADGRYHFKMSEMAMTEERMECVPAFYWLIEKYALASISCKFDVAEHKRASARVRKKFLDLGYLIYPNKFDNSYFFGFRCLLDMFHSNREAIKFLIPLDENVDFIFDNQTEKSFILEAWNDYVAERPDETREYYGATPRFEDDREYLPLQAADLWAWWVREWYEEDSIDLPTKMDNFDFGKWRGKQRPSIAISFNEEQIVTALEALVVEGIASQTGRSS